MLYLVAADHKQTRSEHVARIIEAHDESDVITVDDSMMALSELEQFAYPSLFVAQAPIVLARFLLAESMIDAAFAKLLVASPTVFLLEEFSVSTPIATLLKKSGAQVHVGEKVKRAAASDDLFAATACITAIDKKARWLAYRAAVEKNPIEAILGILYWKLRTLAVKGPAGNAYERLYGEMLSAQARAWQTGAPLEELIEKVILSA